MEALNHTERSNITDHEGPESDGDDYNNEETDNVTKIVFVTAYIIIIIFSLVGNSLVIHLVRTRGHIRKNPFNWLLANTAVADAIDVITASSFLLPQLLVGNRWIPGIVGKILVKIIPYLLLVSICVAIWTLTVIAADRYLAIVSVQPRTLSSRSVVRVIVALWLCGGVIFSGQLYKFQTEVTEDGTTERYDDWHVSEKTSETIYKAEMILRFVLTYAAPLIIMTIFYSLIGLFLWRHKPPGHVNRQAYAKQARNRRAVIKMLITAVTVFTICWFPVHFDHIMSKFYEEAYEGVPTIVQYFFYWLAHANAAIHPWLFIAFSENLRAETKAIFRCAWYWTPYSQNQLPATTSTQSLRVTSLQSKPSTYLAAPRSLNDMNSNLGLETKF